MTKTTASGLKRSYMIKGFAFLLPAAVVYLIFAVIPFIDNLVLSFQKWNGFSDRSFVWFDNFVRAFSDKVFLRSMKNSVYIGGVSSVLSVTVGVLLAWLLLYVPRRPGSLYRTVMFSPSMIPPVITALVFSFVYEPEIGILNNLFEFLKTEGWQRAWLTNRSTVLNAITFVSLWKQVGLTMVLCFAGMQAIPVSLIESAYLEGATSFAIFRRIILPLIMSFVQLSAVFALLSGLKIYDTVLALTGGGPGEFSVVMPMWIMEQTFLHNNFGYGASMSSVFVGVVLLGVVIMRLVVKGTAYEL